MRTRIEHPRHGRLVASRRARGCRGGSCPPSRPRADDEAGLVDEVDDRQAERVAQVDEARELVGRVGGQAAARSGCGSEARTPTGRPSSRASAVISERPKRAPISKTEPRSNTASRIAAHLVRLARVARDDAEQLLLAPVGRVGRRDDRRQLPHVVGQVGEEALDLVERVVLVGRLVVDRARARSARARRRAPPCRAARPSPTRRPAGRRRRAARCRATMTLKCEATTRAAPRPAHGPSAAATTGTQREVRAHELEAGHERHVGEAHRLERLDAAAAARAVDEAHERQAQVVRGRSAQTIFCQIAASAAPPRIVKSSPCTTARRPSMRPWPTTMFAGRKSVELAVARRRCPKPASSPVSWNVPSSKSRSIRSRTVRRPRSCWRCDALLAAHAVRELAGARLPARRVSGSPGHRGRGHTAHRCVWRNWSGEQACVPAAVARPRSTAEVVAAVERAAAAGRVVRVAGAGHSFTDAVLTDGTLLSLDAMDRVLDADPRDAAACACRRASACTRCPSSSPRHGLALENLGDVNVAVDRRRDRDRHARHAASSCATSPSQIEAVQLVAGDGTVHELDGGDELRAARVSRRRARRHHRDDAALRRRVHAARRRRAASRSPTSSTASTSCADAARHFEFFVFPHTDIALTRTNEIVDAPAAAARPRASAGPRTSCSTTTRCALGVRDRPSASRSAIPRDQPHDRRRAQPSACASTAPTASSSAPGSCASPRWSRRSRARRRARSIARDPRGRVRALPGRSSRSRSASSPPTTRSSAPPAGARPSTSPSTTSSGMPWEAPLPRGRRRSATEHGARPHWGKRHFHTAETLAPRYPRVGALPGASARSSTPTAASPTPTSERVLGAPAGAVEAQRLGERLRPRVEQLHLELQRRRARRAARFITRSLPGPVSTTCRVPSSMVRVTTRHCRARARCRTMRRTTSQTGTDARMRRVMVSIEQV